MTDARSPLGPAPAFFDLDAARVACWQMGPTGAPDLLFVHGWPLHAATCRHVAPVLAERFRCHLVDLPTTGASPWDATTPVGLRQHAETLRQLVEALGLARLGLVAHDSGGAIARLLAAELGERVYGMVLSGTEIPGHHPLLFDVLTRTLRLPGSAAVLRGLLRSPRYVRSRFGFGGCFADRSRLEGEFAELFIAPLQDRRVLEGQLRLAQAIDWSVVAELEETHRRIPAPALLLWGRHDPFFPAAKAEAMADQFPGGARFECFEDAALLAHEEHPERFARASLAFLERLVEPARPLRVTA